MEGHRHSVLEARWLLAIPASLLLTVLLAGFLLPQQTGLTRTYFGSV